MADEMEAELNWVVEMGEAPGSTCEAAYWKEKTQLLKEKAEHWKERSIYIVPAYITDMNPKAYLPRVVSFGPYHHDKEHLKPMEEHKARALFNFIKRSWKPFTQFVEAMDRVLDDLMACYDQLDQKWHDDRGEFVQLMILDGCFMLEIMRGAEYAPNDPIFSKHGKLYVKPYVQRDMLMLENQLPVLVLETLVAVDSDGTEGRRFVRELIQRFYEPRLRAMEVGNCLHVLDVFREGQLPCGRTEKTCRSAAARKDRDNIIRSATELHEAGVQFERSDTSLTDVSFKDGILRIPHIKVDDATESMFLNLIAFERFHVGIGNEVSSYLWFMDEIIDNDKDMALLRSMGIIESALGSDKETAKLFNSLSRDALLHPDSSIMLHPHSSIQQVREDVRDYCKRPWNKWMANFRHTHFRSPWTTASLVAAILLFTLAILQTTYTLLQYYH